MLASSPTFPSITSRRRSRSSLSSYSSRENAIAAVVSAARNAEASADPPVFGVSRTAGLPEPPPTVAFDDLGPIGKVVAGVTQIVVSTALEYLGGFFVGVAVGTVVGVPGFLFKPVEPGVPKVFLKEVSGRMGRMNARSLSWAKSWGYYSGVFGGSKIVVKVLRGGQDDNWNTILSSAAAGAIFARAGKNICQLCKYVPTLRGSPYSFALILLQTSLANLMFESEGPQGMLRGAIMYGGLVYILSGGTGGKRLGEYRDERLDF